jgi:hypothetical protein
MRPPWPSPHGDTLLRRLGKNGGEWPMRSGSAITATWRRAIHDVIWAMAGSQRVLDRGDIRLRFHVMPAAGKCFPIQPHKTRLVFRVLGLAI